MFILPKPEIFPSVIGIPYQDFKKLRKKFSKRLRRVEALKYLPESGRVREFGGGRKAVLKTDDEKLFYILLYYKVYPTYRLMEFLFGLDHTNCLRWKDFLETVLNQALAYQFELPTKRVKCLSELITICPALKHCIVDATERTIRRPANKETETKHFSGKRKDHTIKNQIFINPNNRKIIHVSKSFAGSVHDKRVFESDPIYLKAPPGSIFMSDGGYHGISDLSPYIKNPHPFKRKPGCDLTDAQKQTNHALSSIQIKVEHTFAYAKHFNILRHDFRNRLTKADLPMYAIAGIYNFTR